MTEEKPATCLEFTEPCDKAHGGGCCAQGTKCTPQGCEEVFLAAPGPQPSLASTTSPLLPAAPTLVLPTRIITVDPGISLTTEAPDGVTVTATKFPDVVTVTTVKFGEVAQSQGLRSVRLRFRFTSWPALGGFVLSLALILA